MLHRTLSELDTSLDHIRAAPTDAGTLDLLVRRPSKGEREVLDEGELDLELGLVGDRWSRPAPGKTADKDMQINIMSARAIAAIAGPPERWPPAGDQLFVDLDLSVDNLPAGTRLAVGDAVLEVTPEPHNGCKQFVDRYGLDAMKWVNNATGNALRLRGLNARVVTPGTVRPGDAVRVIR